MSIGIELIIQLLIKYSPQIVSQIMILAHKKDPTPEEWQVIFRMCITYEEERTAAFKSAGQKATPMPPMV